MSHFRIQVSFYRYDRTETKMYTDKIVTTINYCVIELLIYTFMAPSLTNNETTMVTEIKEIQYLNVDV